MALPRSLYNRQSFLRLRDRREPPRSPRDRGGSEHAIDQGSTHRHPLIHQDGPRNRRPSRLFRSALVDHPRESRELREMPDDRAEHPVQSGLCAACAS